MPTVQPNAEYEIGTASAGPRWCFPVGYDRDDLVEITQLQDPWCKYINSRTGETVDCAVFAKQWQESLR